MNTQANTIPAMSDNALNLRNRHFLKLDDFTLYETERLYSSVLEVERAGALRAHERASKLELAPTHYYNAMKGKHYGHTAYPSCR